MVARIRAAAVVLAMSSFVFLTSLEQPFAQGTATTGVAAPTAQTSQAAAAAPAGRVDVGAALYRKVGCFQCHVNEAQGGANGPRLGPDPVTFARFTQYVRRPTGDMPPYSEKVLSAQDMADIYAFVRARPRPPAVSAIPLLAP